jgi:hypothetical protein
VAVAACTSGGATATETPGAGASSQATGSTAIVPQDAHKLLRSARRVVVEGEGNHGQSFADPVDDCVQRYLNAYLATGALPERPGLVNGSCPATPDPTPSSS